MTSKIYLLFCLFLIFFIKSNAFNITTLLNQFPSFNTFNSYLTQTQVASAINSRKSVTVLAVDNDNISPLSGKPADVLRKIMSLHAVLDYYDVQKLQNGTTILTSLYQASGQAAGQRGFLNSTVVKNGGVVIDSVGASSTHGAYLIKSIVSIPYSISILQVSTVIAPMRMVSARHETIPPSPPAPPSKPTIPTPRTSVTLPPLPGITLPPLPPLPPLPAILPPLPAILPPLPPMPLPPLPPLPLPPIGSIFPPTPSMPPRIQPTPPTAQPTPPMPPRGAPTPSMPPRGAPIPVLPVPIPIPVPVPSPSNATADTPAPSDPPSDFDAPAATPQAPGPSPGPSPEPGEATPDLPDDAIPGAGTIVQLSLSFFMVVSTLIIVQLLILV